jgi:hypothetical protein
MQSRDLDQRKHKIREKKSILFGAEVEDFFCFGLKIVIKNR